MGSALCGIVKKHKPFEKVEQAKEVGLLKTHIIDTDRLKTHIIVGKLDFSQCRTFNAAQCSIRPCLSESVDSNTQCGRIYIPISNY